MSETIQLKAIRELRNYSQQYTAKMIGVSQSYYSKLENGQAKLTADLVQRVLKVFEINTLHPLFLGNDNFLEGLIDQTNELQKMKEILNSLVKRVEQLERIVEHFNINPKKHK